MGTGTLHLLVRDQRKLWGEVALGLTLKDGKDVAGRNLREEVGVSRIPSGAAPGGL